MPVDVAGLVARQEKRDLRNLIGLAAPAKRVQLADRRFLSPHSGHVVNALRHAGLDEAGTNGVDSDIAVAELDGSNLHEVDDPRFRSRISRAARAGANARDAGRADDRPAAPLLHVRS